MQGHKTVCPTGHTVTLIFQMWKKKKVGSWALPNKDVYLQTVKQRIRNTCAVYLMINCLLLLTEFWGVNLWSKHLRRNQKWLCLNSGVLNSSLLKQDHNRFNNLCVLSPIFTCGHESPIAGGNLILWSPNSLKVKKCLFWIFSNGFSETPESYAYAPASIVCQ